MRQWSFYFNQQPLLTRVVALFAVLVLIGCSWYLLLAKDVFSKTQEHFETKQRLEKTLLQLQQLSNSEEDYIYNDALETFELRHVLDGLVSTSEDLVLSDFKNVGVRAIPVGGQEFSSASSALGVSLLTNVFQKQVSLEFKGEFYDFLEYLKAIKASPYAIYFDTLQFDMPVYPEADITMAIFTLKRDKG